MATKERILQFIDFKGLSKRKFCDLAGLSHTIFNSNSAMGSDKLEMISATFPELNMDWVIRERGEMEYREPQMLVGSDEGAKLAIQVQKDTIMELQAKLIKCMEGQGYVPLSMNEAMPKEENVE